jgi:hypothetical protein
VWLCCQCGVQHRRVLLQLKRQLRTSHTIRRRWRRRLHWRSLKNKQNIWSILPYLSPISEQIKYTWNNLLRTRLMYTALYSEQKSGTIRCHSIFLPACKYEQSHLHDYKRRLDGDEESLIFSQSTQQVPVIHPLDTLKYISINKLLHSSAYIIIFFIRTYAEEEIAEQFPTEREWVYNFANAKIDNLATKKCILLKTFFFSRKQFFLFYNFNTATHDRLKNRIFE